jgi:hypothetical protein
MNNSYSPISLNDLLSEIHLGVEESIFYLTFNNINDEKVSKLGKLYAQDPTRDLESLCDEVEMPHSEFLGRVVASLYDVGISMTRLIVSLYLPTMVKRSIEHALTDDGEAERIEWLRATGLFVTPNKVININTNQSITLNSASDYGLPKFEDTLAIGENAIRDSEAMDIESNPK